MPDEKTFIAAEASGMSPAFSGKKGTFWKLLQMADESYEDVTPDLDKNKFYRVILTKLEGTRFRIADVSDDTTDEYSRSYISCTLEGSFQCRNTK
jgi:hypothetical protein